jgi:hypothetical protein
MRVDRWPMGKKSEVGRHRDSRTQIFALTAENTGRLRNADGVSETGTDATIGQDTSTIIAGRDRNRGLRDRESRPLINGN